ncbi:hypothetical protein BREVNS_0400 [Brevinematales bacterium NS]|nr:hypothetical protein BREVNS_0400 [Brevinematales bacterium NS]
MFSSPIWVRGYAPLPRFFCSEGLICLFYSKKMEVFITTKNIFYTLFCFYSFFETSARMCKGLKTGFFYPFLVY